MLCYICHIITVYHLFGKLPPGTFDLYHLLMLGDAFILLRDQLTIVMGIILSKLTYDQIDLNN